MSKKLIVNSQQELFEKIGCRKIFEVLNGLWIGCYVKDNTNRVRCNMINDGNEHEWPKLKTLDWDFFRYIDEMDKGELEVNVYEEDVE